MGKQAVNKAILSSSEMHQFCKDTALKILNFFEQENFPVMAEDIKPFLEVITEEVENFQYEGDIVRGQRWNYKGRKSNN